MNTQNFYNHAKKSETCNPNYKITHIFQVPFRMVIIGGSGSGKTNTLLNIIHTLDKTFTRIVLCTKDANEPLYNLLKESLDDEQLVIFEDGKVPHLNDVAIKDKKDKLPSGAGAGAQHSPQLIVFDDLCLEKDQSRIGEYFIRARKQNISCIYLTQSYFKVPKAVRLQSNYFILKRSASRDDLTRILKQSILPFKIDELLRLYSIATQNFEDFLLIDNNLAQVHKSFEIEPMVVPETVGVCINNKRVENQHIKKKSSDLFIEYLKGAGLNDEYDIKDVYEAYQNFCDKNHIVPTAKNRLGIEMAKHFPRRKFNMKYLYSL